MISQKQIEEWLQEFSDVWGDYPFGEEVVAYKRGDKAVDEGRMFALIQEGSVPVRLSLRCDPQLALILREKYETILPGQNLNKKQWNTIICSGQLNDEETRDLINHAYQQVEVQE